MILASLGQVEPLACYRVISPAYAGMPLSGMGAAGLDGIVFPSQARPGGSNLVVYSSASRPASQLRVYDPAGVLSRITTSPGS